MKHRIFYKYLILCIGIIIFFSIQLYAQGIGISGDNSPPDSSAILELKSNNKGFLPPRLTAEEIALIDDPAEGLVVFNTTSGCINFYVMDIHGGHWSENCGTAICLPPCTAFEQCWVGHCEPCCFNYGGTYCSGSTDYGSLCGDESMTWSFDECGAGWYRIYLDECDNSIIIPSNVSMQIYLDSPTGMNYDLYIYEPCGTLISSTSGTDLFNINLGDDIFTDQGTTFFIEVRLVSGVICDDWVMEFTTGIF